MNQPKAENFDSLDGYQEAMEKYAPGLSPDQEVESYSFWDKQIGRVIRWIAFLPTGFALAFLLYYIPIFAVAYAMSYNIEMTLFSIMLAIFLVSVALGFMSFWFMGVYSVPMLCCGFIAPNAKVASIIYGTFYVFNTIIGGQLPMLFSYEKNWWLIIYSVVFSIIHFVGIVFAYKSDEYS
ncbi:MAG: hypothetical protein MI685_09135 [Chlorobiales bacterium]|nr:hypothetical protein [Chlorobiales bacterium]